jgi:hypothetical protein
MELASLSKQPSGDDQSLVRRFHPCDRHPDKAAFRSAEVASATGQSWLGGQAASQVGIELAVAAWCALARSGRRHSDPADLLALATGEIMPTRRRHLTLPGLRLAYEERKRPLHRLALTASLKGKGGAMEPATTGHDAIGHDESPVQHWRGWQLSVWASLGSIRSPDWRTTADPYGSRSALPADADREDLSDDRTRELA